METSILKIDEAELLLFYSHTSPHRHKPEWQSMNQITDKLLYLINEHRCEDAVNVVPPNKHNWSVAPHFSYLLDLNWRDNIDQYEYYMLFVQEKS